MAATPNTPLESLAFRVTALEMLVDELARTANKTVFAGEPNRAETGRDPSHPRSAAALPQLDPEDERTRVETRRTNAEAERVELEVAALRRTLRADDRNVQAGRLWVEFNADKGEAAICAAEDGGPELRITIRSERLIWLAEHLLVAKRGLDGAEA